MEKHPTVVSILQENGGKMDRLSLASDVAKKYGMTIDYGYSFIRDAVQDGVCTETCSGITYHIRLVGSPGLDQKIDRNPAKPNT